MSPCIIPTIPSICVFYSIPLMTILVTCKQSCGVFFWRGSILPTQKFHDIDAVKIILIVLCINRAYFTFLLLIFSVRTFKTVWLLNRPYKARELEAAIRLEFTNNSIVRRAFYGVHYVEVLQVHLSKMIKI